MEANATLWEIPHASVWCLGKESFATNAAFSDALSDVPGIYLDYFSGPFGVGLLSHSILSSVAWVALFGAVMMAIQGFILVAGGSFTFVRFQPVPALLTYPLLTFLCATLGWVVAAYICRSPIFLEGYNFNSARSRKLGTKRWLMQQMRYSAEMVWISFVPGWISFILFQHLAETSPQLTIVIYGALQLWSLWMFYILNRKTDARIWMNPLAGDQFGTFDIAKTREGARERVSRLYLTWGAAKLTFLIAALLMSLTAIPVQMQSWIVVAALGVSIGFAVLVVSAWE